MDSELAPLALLGLTGHGVLAVGVLREGIIAWGSPAFLALFGLDPDTTGKRFLDLVAPDDRAALAAALDQAHGAGMPPTPFRGQRTDGGSFDGEIVGTALELPGGPGIAVALRDVSEQRRAEKQLSYLAFRDPLTELPNRALFFDRLHQTLVDARRHGSAFAVLIADLDGFKHVNDQHGHETGDALLQVAAKRLRAATREGDSVARIGGDEFAALLPRASTPEEASVVADRMAHALAAPIVIAGQTCQVGLSVGVALYPADGRDMDALVAHADGAMYAAKRAGGGRFEFARARAADLSGPLRLPLFAWGEAHTLGIQLMDGQHKNLAALINRLGEELKAGQDAEQVKRSFAALGQAARAHFGAEERLLLDAGLEAAAERHRHEQSNLLHELASQSVKLGERSMALTMRHLHDWLSRHIEADRPYARELIARGAST